MEFDKIQHLSLDLRNPIPKTTTTNLKTLELNHIYHKLNVNQLPDISQFTKLEKLCVIGFNCDDDVPIFDN